MPSGNLDSGVRAEDLEAAFAGKKSAPKEQPFAGLTAKQQKEVKSPAKVTKTKPNS